MKPNKTVPSLDSLEQTLMKTAEAVATVDVHQHLGPEVPVQTDLCRLMVSDYLATDLISAGMTLALKERIADMSRPLMERWHLLAPFWKHVELSSYAQSNGITLKTFYGAQTLAEEEIEPVSERLTSDFSAPGIFQRVFCDRCNIQTVLTQCASYFSHAKPVFRNVARPLDRSDFSPGGQFESDARSLGRELQTADDLVPAMDAILRAQHARGAVGFKIAALPWQQPGPAELKHAFARRSKTTYGYYNFKGEDFPLIQLYVARIAALAAEFNIPVAVHTGAPWGNWLDFRAWEPTSIIPLLSAFQDTHFDLYHAGVPYGTQASMLGKAFPNVWMNLTWAHIISAELARRCITEWLDLVPLNKVIGFGGDHGNASVVLTYGDLSMARRNIVSVLASRIRARQMDQAKAETILQLWFRDNPIQLYHLESASRCNTPVELHREKNRHPGTAGTIECGGG